MVYGDFKDVSKRSASNKICNKAFEIAEDHNIDGYEIKFNFTFILIYNFFDIKAADTDTHGNMVGVSIKNTNTEAMQNEKLVYSIHK